MCNCLFAPAVTFAADDAAARRRKFLRSLPRQYSPPLDKVSIIIIKYYH